MSSRQARNLVAYAPDRTAVVVRTSGDYTVAGRMHLNGTWTLAARGWSDESVRRRTARIGRLRGCDDVDVRPLWEETAPLIRAYFGTHAVRVASRFTPGEGWTEGLRMNAGKSALRQLALNGVTAVGVSPAGASRVIADFQMTEIARSCQFRLPAGSLQ